jgi:hypothetical protein
MLRRGAARVFMAEGLGFCAQAGATAIDMPATMLADKVCKKIRLSICVLLNGMK